MKINFYYLLVSLRTWKRWCCFRCLCLCEVPFCRFADTRCNRNTKPWTLFHAISDRLVVWVLFHTILRSSIQTKLLPQKIKILGKTRTYTYIIIFVSLGCEENMKRVVLFSMSVWGSVLGGSFRQPQVQHGTLLIPLPLYSQLALRNGPLFFKILLSFWKQLYLRWPEFDRRIICRQRALM